MLALSYRRLVYCRIVHMLCAVFSFLLSYFTRLVELIRWHQNLVLIVLSLSSGLLRGVGSVIVI